MAVTADIIVIGAGIAGVSAASELAKAARVIVLERESRPAYHATGRSAAFFTVSYGNAAARALAAASAPFYHSPPKDFTDTPLFRPRPCIFFGRPDQRAALHSLRDKVPSLQKLSAQQVRRQVPVMLPGYLEGGLLDEAGGDLDVDAILQGFLRRLRARGGELYPARGVQALSRSNGLWKVAGAGATLAAPLVVNAAGAWVDDVARQAGLAPLGLQPKRRTAMLIDAPEGRDVSNWPLMVNVEEEFYFKPNAGALLLSPADETPSLPCDARPEAPDVALALDRFKRATGLEVAGVTRCWAGLRTFAPDNTFVVGFDPRTEGFFWLAGQGGYGVLTSPGMARLAASLVTGSSLPELTGTDGDLVGKLAPDRLLT